MEDRWLAYAKRLQAIASTGLFFGADDFDRERYQEIGEIAQQMLSELADVPIHRIAQLIPDYAVGYTTPKVDVRGAVISDDRILLVQERSDQLWTLPGGYADVGLSAADNTAKEISEEANLQVKASKLFAVRHKARHGYKPDVRDFYKFYFLCEPLDGEVPSPGAETMAADYFAPSELPPLSTGRVIAEDIHMAFEHYRDPQKPTLFD
ncbi:MAG: NUDIX hydrolase [Pseudomonadota bacterium]